MAKHGRSTQTPESLTGKQIFMMAGAFLVIAGGILWSQWPDPPEEPGTLHTILLDPSEGIDEEKHLAFTHFIGESLKQMNPGDTADILLITEKSRNPLLRLHQVEVKASFEQLQEKCGEDRGKLPVCGSPIPSRFSAYDEKCGRPAILAACKQTLDTARAVQQHEAIPKNAAELPWSPLVESLQDADDQISHWLMKWEEQAGEEDLRPRRGRIFIFSDMLQNTPWYSQVIQKKPFSVPFTQWNDFSIFAAKSQEAMKLPIGLGAFEPIESPVTAHVMKHEGLTAHTKEQRNLELFWKNLMADRKQLTWVPLWEDEQLELARKRQEEERLGVPQNAIFPSAGSRGAPAPYIPPAIRQDNPLLSALHAELSEEQLQNGTANVHILIDISGSVSEDDVGDFMNHVHTVAHTTKAQPLVILGDTEVDYESRYTGGNMFNAGGEAFEAVRKHGNGGTDFRPLMKRSDKGRPDLMVFLTDGHGDFPERTEIRSRVVWVTMAPCWEEGDPEYGRYTHRENCRLMRQFGPVIAFPEESKLKSAQSQITPQPRRAVVFSTADSDPPRQQGTTR